MMRQTMMAMVGGAVCAAVMTMAGSATAQMPGALEECLKLAGEPTAEAPVSRDAGSATFSALAKARPHCEAALIGPEQDARVLFHMAVIMQREGFHTYALRAFNMAASNGVTAAYTKVGDYYNFGIGGIRENHRRAVENYMKAAQGGDLPAKATLAIMHQIGRGVPQDFGTMFALLEETADAGYHFSQLRLAELYMSPDDVSPELAQKLDLPDPIKATEFYELAAAQGNSTAQAELAKFADGEGLFDDPAVRLKLINRGVERGEPSAIKTLGFMHEQGDGVEYNAKRAADLYIDALKAGLPVQELRLMADGRFARWDRETALEFQVNLQNMGLYLGFLDAVVGPGTMAAAAQVAQQAQNSQQQ
ncbi:MAG: tetratricopeptide repeat protein [Pseudomonadota bacterium]